METLISRTLSAVTLGLPVTHASITMLPLLGPPDSEQEPFYLTLDQGLGDGWTEITEVSEQGSVPPFDNGSGRPEPGRVAENAV